MVGRDVAEVFIEAEKGTWEISDTNTKGKKNNKRNSNVIYVMKNTDQNDKIQISNTKFTYKCRS